ncbi:MAG TPA: DUF4129 domain-containing protein [Steroidobacteraceae bacterium]|nr:DUF4129 domain-containing protein [Steroidobacteraceae bacterium]
MTRALLALLLAAALVPCAQARDALQVIDECIARLDTELDVGYPSIAARCPDLTPALTQSPWAPWLPAGWNRQDNQLSRSGLAELRALLAREVAPEVSRRPPLHPERVAAVLATVVERDAGSLSWWQRFKDWLHRILAARATGRDHWLAHWLTQIKLATSTTQLIVWSALALVVALAAGIVINELRIAGLLGSRAGRTQTRNALEQAPGAALVLEQIERAAPERQPGLLLELIALRLAEQDRLPPARALTARELTRRARLPDESGRTQFAELVGVCERLRFSAERVSDASLAAALRSGRTLLAALAAPALATPAAQVR